MHVVCLDNSEFVTRQGFVSERDFALMSVCEANSLHARGNEGKVWSDAEVRYIGLTNLFSSEISEDSESRLEMAQDYAGEFFGACEFKGHRPHHVRKAYEFYAFLTWAKNRG